jgi:hypothetical protein
MLLPRLGGVLATASCTEGIDVVSRASSIRAFRQAIGLLRSIDPDLSLYVASDTLCLMRGPSHDDHGRPQQQNVIDSTGSLRISGGDW